MPSKGADTASSDWGCSDKSGPSARKEHLVIADLSQHRTIVERDLLTNLRVVGRDSLVDPLPHRLPSLGLGRFTSFTIGRTVSSCRQTTTHGRHHLPFITPLSPYRPIRQRALTGCRSCRAWDCLWPSRLGEVRGDI
jgi:hypothetical protein